MKTRYCKYCAGPIPKKNHSEKYYNKRNFCSYSCNGSYQTLSKRKPFPERFCQYCSKKIIPGEWDYPKSFANRKYCDHHCATKHHWQNPDYRALVTKNVTAAVRAYARTPDARAKQSERSLANWERPEYRENVITGLKEFSDSPEIRQRRSERALKTWARPGHREHVSKVNSEITLALWQDPKYVKKVMEGQNIHPNNPESQIIHILNELKLNFDFTGGGGFTLAGKVPDFVNLETQQIIEHYGDHWHTEEEAKARVNLFQEHGFDTLIIWEQELADINSVKTKILNFIAS